MFFSYNFFRKEVIKQEFLKGFVMDILKEFIAGLLVEGRNELEKYW